MITEADARVLEYGSTVVLVAGGHVTPLAHDTLQARRISVVREGADRRRRGAGAARPTIRTVAIAGDHTSLALKARDRAAPARPRHRRPRPRHRRPASRWTIRTPPRRRRVQVARGEADAAIVIDGAGLGSTIAANKVAGVARGDVPERDAGALRARSTTAPTCWRSASTLVTRDEALAIVDTFLDTPMREAALHPPAGQDSRPRDAARGADADRRRPASDPDHRRGAGRGRRARRRRRAARATARAVRVLSRPAARRARGRRDAARAARRRRRRRRRGRR